MCWCSAWVRGMCWCSAWVRPGRDVSGILGRRHLLDLSDGVHAEQPVPHKVGRQRESVVVGRTQVVHI